MSLSDIALLLLVSVVALYVWRAQGVRELALRATRDYCRRMDLQLLDDTVALRAVWFKRDKHGVLRFWRAYQFDFTCTGEERYRGRTITLGNRIENIVLPPHRFERSEDRAP